MNKLQASVLAGTFAVTVGVLIYEVRIVGEQRSELQALRKRHAARQELQRSPKAVAATQAPRPSTDVSAPATHELPSTARSRESEVNAWLARVQQAKDIFGRHPELAIPEMVLLQPMDWLNATREGNLDDEPGMRKTLAAVRTAAKEHLVHPLSRAYDKYVKLNDGQIPPTVIALAPYIDAPYLTTPIDAGMLQRYEMSRSGKVKDLAPAELRRAVLREKSPIDEDNDWRLQIDPQGVRMGYAGIIAWVEDYFGRYDRARAAYSQANNGAKSTDIAQLVPLMTPPLTAVQAEKIIAFERARGR